MEKGTEHTLLLTAVVAVIFGLVFGYIFTAIAFVNAWNLPFIPMTNTTKYVPITSQTSNYTSSVEQYLNTNFLSSYQAQAVVTNTTNVDGIIIMGIDVIQNNTKISGGNVYVTPGGQMLLLGTLYNMSVPVPQQAQNQTQAVAQTAPSAATNISTQTFESNPTLYPSVGPSNASNTIIEFADFQCPYCAMASGISSGANQYASQYPDLVGSALKSEQLALSGKARFIYVSMSFLGQESVNAAEASLCANAQGKFWEMHDAIFSANDMKEDDGKYVVGSLEAMAQNITGLNQTEFKNCLENGTEQSSLTAITQAANSVGVSSTPTFIVNGKEVSASWQAINASIR